MANGNDGNDVAMEELTIAHEGFKKSAATGDVDGRDFLVWQRHVGAQDGEPKAVVGDFTGDGHVDGHDYLVGQRGVKGVEPDSEGLVAFERLGAPETSSLKAGASEVLMESVSIVSPRDSASGQASAFALDSEDPGPSVLMDLASDPTAEPGGADAFVADFELDMDLDI